MTVVMRSNLPIGSLADLDLASAARGLDSVPHFNAILPVMKELDTCLLGGKRHDEEAQGAIVDPYSIGTYNTGLMLALRICYWENLAWLASALQPTDEMFMRARVGNEEFSSQLDHVYKAITRGLDYLEELSNSCPTTLEFSRTLSLDARYKNPSRYQSFEWPASNECIDSDCARVVGDHLLEEFRKLLMQVSSLTDTVPAAYQPLVQAKTDFHRLVREIQTGAAGACEVDRAYYSEWLRNCRPFQSELEDSSVYVQVRRATILFEEAKAKHIHQLPEDLRNWLVAG